jgi:serine/threonine protein kinase
MFKSKTEQRKVIRGELTDIWALGITFFELITGQTPYSDIKNIFELRDAVLDRPIDFSEIKNTQVRDFLEMILQKDPNKRASLEDILQCDWITKRGKEIVNVEFTSELAHRFPQCQRQVIRR